MYDNSIRMKKCLIFLQIFLFFLLSLQGRIKKIMQSDEEVGKVAQAVPIIIYILFKIKKKQLHFKNAISIESQFVRPTPDQSF